MKIFFKILFFVLIIISCKQIPKVENVEIPKEYRFENQVGYVNDFDDILTLEEENNLEKIFTDYDNNTTNEVGVITVKSIKPFSDINQFGDEILNNWRFGKDDKFNGILFVVDKKNRQISVRFGKGIQNKMSNEEAKKILDQNVLPKFKEENFYDGIISGFEAIKEKIK